MLNPFKNLCMKHSVLLLLLNILYLISFPQTSTSFNKLLGGNTVDYIRSVQQTSDNGYIMAGYTYSSNNGTLVGMTSNGVFDGWIIKLNETGTVQWQKLFGGTGEDYANSIRQTSDGGYVVAGQSFSSNSGTLAGLTNNGVSDVWVLKLNVSGDIQWQKFFGGTGEDYANSIRQTSDGGYILAGTYNGGVSGWVLKLDDNGNLQWQKILGGLQSEFLLSAQQTTDGGYIIAGYTGSSNSGTLIGVTHNGGYDCWVIKLDAAGDTQWQKLFGSVNNDYGRSIQQTSDGGYIIGGYARFSNSGTLAGLANYGDDDGWIIKLDVSGNIQWQKLFGGSLEEYVFDISQTSDGGYLTAGITESSNTGTISGLINHGNYDFYIVKFSSGGTIERQALLGGSVSDYPFSIQPTSDGGYIVAGNSRSSNTGTLGGIFNHGSEDAWIFKQSLSVLPVSLAKFDAQCMAGKFVLITWITSQELNNDYFEVQKTVNGMDWIVVSHVTSSGNSITSKNYQVKDLNTGAAQYRLKQVDKNGSVTFSVIIKTSCEGKNASVLLYPSPARDMVKLVIPSDSEERTSLQILDKAGRMVMRIPVTIRNGTTDFEINVQPLSTGQYMIHSTNSAVKIDKVFTVIK